MHSHVTLLNSASANTAHALVPSQWSLVFSPRFMLKNPCPARRLFRKAVRVSAYGIVLSGTRQEAACAFLHDVVETALPQIIECHLFLAIVVVISIHQ